MTRRLFLIGSLIFLLPVVALAQGAGRSFNFSTMDLNAGEFIFDFEKQQIESMSRGADVTLYPDNPGERPLRMRAREIKFEWGDAGSSEPESMLLEGDVIISHPQGEIRAARGLWTVQDSLMVFTGNPRVETAQLGTLTGERLELNLMTGRFSGAHVTGRGLTIGSRGDAPGSSANLLAVDSVEDWPAFLTAIQQDVQRDSPNPGKHIASLMTPQVRAGFENLANQSDFAEGQKRLVVDALNGLLLSPRLYNAEAWSETEVPADIVTMARTPELPEAELVMVNRALLHAAYPGFVGPHSPVAGTP